MDNAFEYLVKELEWKDGDVVVAGISGGPDSMALLHLLIRTWRALFIKDIKITIVCAHVNHKVRKESDEEEIFVKEYCEKNRVIFDCYHIEKYDDENFHKDARDKRYNYYEELVNKYHAKYLFTAHHGDDLMETILMRITRGSTLKGYSGFSKVVQMKNYKLIRPLIEVTKQEIAEYDEKNKIEYAIDKTNFDDVYTRNRFRKYFLPLFKKEEKNVHHKFLKFSNTILEANNYIEKQANIKMKKIYVNNVLNIEDFLKEEHIIQMHIIYSIFEKIYGDNLKHITDKHISLFYELLVSKKGNCYIKLPNNMIAKKEYNKCMIVPLEVNNNYNFEFKDYILLPNGKRIEKIEDTELNGNDICRLDSKEIKLPLYIRNRINGDKMSILGMNGRKKVNDIFIDNKIIKSERDIWPVVVDSNENIVWLPGLKKSKFSKQKNEKYDIILKYY